MTEYFALAPGNAVSCGLRLDLPKAQRRHAWVRLGLDERHNPDTGEFRPRIVYACATCGRDRDEALPPGPLCLACGDPAAVTHTALILGRCQRCFHRLWRDFWHAMGVHHPDRQIRPERNHR